MPESTDPAALIDWGLASRIGRKLGGHGDDSLGTEHARTVCGEALERALAYTTLEPTSEVPEVEVVPRDEWINANLAELMLLAAPLEERMAGELSLPGPLDTLARKGIGAAAGAEAGVLLGYAAKRVLGQYQVSLRVEEGEPRLLLVGANLADAADKLGVDSEPFLMWVSIHEQTHSIQFHSVPWLRGHLVGLVDELMKGAAGGLDVREILNRAKSLVSPDPREGMRRILRGELSRIFASPEQAEAMDQVQAAMAVIEGYAEHVMDAASAGEPELESMRARMDERRSKRTGLADLIARALGLGAKLRQYELGKAWCDAVVAEAGIEGLDQVWTSPDHLPTLAELEDADGWIGRVLSPTPA